MVQAINIILELLSKDSLAISGLNNLFYFISKTYNIEEQQVKQAFQKLQKEGKILEIKKESL